MFKSKWIKLVATASLVGSLFTSALLPSAEAGLADGHGKFLGNVIGNSGIPSHFAEYWNQVTPENATKWGSVESSRDNYNWSGADQAYNYAKSQGFPFRFHTLVWGSQEPGWVSGLSAAEQRAEVEEWIRDAGQRYIDAEYVDVVNEPLHAPPSYKNAIGGDGATGWDWVIWSFEQARQAFPNSELHINDYGIIGDPSKADQYVQLINLLKSRGLVDGIGIQAHHFNMDYVSVSTMNQVLSKLTATGLPIYVTELDMTGDDNTQLQRYQEKFPVLWEHPNVAGITLWGYIVGETWREGTGLITSSGQERPALQWLRQYFNDNGGSPGVPAAPTGLTATAGDGQVSLSWNPSSGATSYTVKRSVFNGGPYAIMGTISGTSFTDNNATNGITFYYVVSAENSAGSSANSSQVSATPQDGGGGPIPTGNLVVQYRAADTNATDNQIKPHFNIKNNGSSPVDLSSLKIRYYFTKDGNQNVNAWIDWAQVGGSNITATFHSTSGTNADTYVELSFSSGAGSIQPGGQSGDIQLRMSKTDWSNFNESNDYSYDPAKTSFTDWDRVTLYQNGVLVWGTAP
ncbi:hypothetical protein DUZ99_14615 [Xylanibacillus composti]|nr:hypothetical protein [Xylanibacillus composti]